jgi:hypothetical protein
MRAGYFVFDLDNGQVSLGQAKHSAESQIVAVQAGPHGLASAINQPQYAQSLRPCRPTRPHPSPLPSHRKLRFLRPTSQLVARPPLLLRILVVRRPVNPCSRRLSHGATDLLFQAPLRVLLLLSEYPFLFPGAPLQVLLLLFRASRQVPPDLSRAPLQMLLLLLSITPNTFSADSTVASDTSSDPNDFPSRSTKAF